jgi:hypothetical protein
MFLELCETLTILAPKRFIMSDMAAGGVACVDLACVTAQVNPRVCVLWSMITLIQKTKIGYDKDESIVHRSNKRVCTQQTLCPVK